MANWLGYETLPRPVLATGAHSAIAATLAAVDGQRVGVRSPEPVMTALVFERRCLSCHTFYGMARLYVPCGGGFSAHLDTLCIRQQCRHLTVTLATESGITLGVSAYEGGPPVGPGHAQQHRNGQMAGASRR